METVAIPIELAHVHIDLMDGLHGYIEMYCKWSRVWFVIGIILPPTIGFIIWYCSWCSPSIFCCFYTITSYLAWKKEGNKTDNSWPSWTSPNPWHNWRFLFEGKHHKLVDDIYGYCFWQIYVLGPDDNLIVFSAYICHPYYFQIGKINWKIVLSKINIY